MIHASEARLRAILRASRDAAVVFDRDGSIRYAAPAAEVLLGQSSDELDHRSFWELVHPDDLTAGLAVMARGLDHRGSATIEWRICDGKGRWRWVEQHVDDMTDNPAVEGVLCHLTDIGDRRELEVALQDSAERVHDLFAHQPVGAALFAEDGTAIAVNPSLCRLLGRDEADLVGRSFDEFAHPADAGIGREEIRQLFAGQIDRFQLDKRYLRPDGAELAGRWTVWLSRDGDGAVRYGVGTLEDITDRMHTHALLEDRERHLRLALSAAETSIWDIDLVSGEARVFSPSRRALPVENDSIVTTLDHLVAVVHPADRWRFEQAIAAVEPSRDEFDFDCRIRPRAADESRWGHVKGQVLRDADGVARRIAGVTVDIDDRHRAAQEAHEVAAAFRQTIDVSNDAFIGIAEGGRIVEWNPAATRMFGHSKEHAIGRSAVDLLVPDRGRSPLADAIARHTRDDADTRGQGAGIGPVELELTDRDGRQLLVEVSGSRIRRGDQVVVHLFLRDVTDRRAAVAQLEEGMLTDPLTGFPNRALLGDRLASALARLDRSPGMVAVFFVDLDRFKVVNDSLGHDAGDALLVNVAGRIRRALRPQDTVARFGGDEFVVVTEDLGTVEDALGLAQRLVDAIDAPLVVRSHQFHLGVSIGIAVARHADADAGSLIRDADLAMYRVKSRGGRGYELFDEDMRRVAMARLDLEADLRRALDQGELEVYYQPVVRLDGAIAGIEALVRWHHPQRGLISPAEFVPIAEDTGLIGELGTMVLETACTQTAAWRRELAPDLHVSVNLSVRQLNDPALPDLVSAVLERTGLSASALTLELTETALMHDAAGAGTALRRIAAMGVSIAVDDFGTGYSSLLYLRRFPVGALKLDRYFVAGVALESEDRVIVGAVIELAHALDLRAVAEGVENDDQRKVLAELGCDYVQGFLFGHAMPAPRFEQVLRGEAMAADGPVAVPAVAPVMIGTGRAPDRAPHRVVLVDDSPGDRSLLRVSLQHSGQFVVVGEAECAPDAIEVVAREQPDVVLVDLFLPGSDGIALLEDLYRVAPTTRPVIVSGFVSDGVAMAAEAAGALACLDKSLSPGAMIDALTSLLAGVRASAN